MENNKDLMFKSGLILVDKPKGISSAAVVAKVKKRFSFNKIGHCGTLDPFATGLMILTVGGATKLGDYWINSDKKYSGIIKLGLKTTSFDITGEVTDSHDVPEISDEILNKLSDNFIGEIDQIPPNYSAIKVGGIRSYQRAREGEEFVLNARKIKIYSLVLKLISPDEIYFEVSCSKGTYIRSLARDIGDFIGCGACLKELRRLSSGDFEVSNSLTLAELLESDLERILINVPALFKDFPAIKIDEAQSSFVKFGTFEKLPLEIRENVHLFDSNDIYLGSFIKIGLDQKFIWNN